MKIALICSHGGHLTEMLYLIEAFEDHDIFFITYDNPRTKNLNYKKYLFPNFGENYFEFIKNSYRIITVLIQENPDIIVSNGSEIAIPFFIVGKLLKKKTIFIECYTRLDMPTFTGKIVFPITDLFLVLWPEMLNNYGRKAQYLGGLFSFIESENNTIKYKKNNILVIVGMHYQGFDRLVKKMDEIAARISNKVIMQIGNTKYEPKNADFFRFKGLDSEIKELIKNSKVVLCQGAMAIIDSLYLETPVIAIPRLKRFNEHLNDHQLVFARKLEELGLVKVVEDIDELESAIYNLNNNITKKIQINRILLSRIRYFIENCRTDRLDGAFK